MNARGLVQRGQRWVPAARRGVVVLAYHLVGGGTDSPVDVPRARFIEQLDQLAETTEVLGLEQAIQSAARLSSRPRVVLTFDDAYRNFAELAWPLLQERKLSAVLYVPTGFVSGSAGPPLTGAALPACTWAELRELQRAGVELGSHGVRHVDLRRLSDAELEQELTASRDTMRRELGVAPTSFCYIQAKHDRRVIAATARHYRNAMAAGGRRFQGRDLHCIPRTPVRRDDINFAQMLTTRLWLTEAVANAARLLRP